MTKVMLINPPRIEYEQSAGFNTYLPIGLLGIAAMIRDICELKILDCLMTHFRIKQTKEYILYGTPFDKIKKIIQDFNPDIVGISTPYSEQSDNAMIICKMCKEINPNMIVVFGGPDSSVRYEQLLKETACDFCVTGEGEKTFFEFINNFNSKQSLKNIEGVAYRTKGGIHHGPRPFLDNLDELPLPAYDLVDMKAYITSKYLYKNRSGIRENSISMITSRGCPFNCIFCSIKLHMGKKYRYHSPDYVIRHITLLVKKYGITNFHFDDDNISLNKKRFEQILDKITENKLKINWDAPNGLRADTLDYNLLKKIKKSGCDNFMVAIESGNQVVLDNIVRKNASLKYMVEIVKHCKKLRINVGAFYIIGFPGETIENMKETTSLALKLLRKYGVIPRVNLATPLIGTDLYNLCIEKGFIKKDLTDKEIASASKIYGNTLISTKDFTPSDVKNVSLDYLRKLKKELMIHALKHPLFAIKKIINKPDLIIRFFKGINSFLRPAKN
ncbi:MAG: radical SAM protein [Nanoarchaeota archaeon]